MAYTARGHQIAFPVKLPVDRPLSKGEIFEICKLAPGDLLIGVEPDLFELGKFMVYIEKNSDSREGEG